MHRARHILRRAPLALPRNHLVRGVTTYTYHADGRVEHSQSGEKLVAPLSAEAAGDRYCEYPRMLDNNEGGRAVDLDIGEFVC